MKTTRLLRMALSVVLLGTSIAACAQTKSGTAYKLSDMQGAKHMPPPIPLGAVTDLRSPLLRILPDQDIWLIDDTALMPTSNKMRPKVSAEIARSILAEIIVEDQRAYMLWMATNKVVLPEKAFVPPKPFTNWYNTTNMHIGISIITLEKLYPGSITNFRPEQIVLETNKPSGIPPGMQRLPNGVNPYDSEQLQQWKRKVLEEREKTNPEPYRGSGGGDTSQFPNVSWYALSFQPFAAPSPDPFPHWDGDTNHPIQRDIPFMPSDINWSALEGRRLHVEEFHNTTNAIGLNLFDGSSVHLNMSYPDSVITRNLDGFTCGAFVLLGECDSSISFGETNFVRLDPGATHAAWSATPNIICNENSGGGGVEVYLAEMTGPQYLFNWDLIRKGSPGIDVPGKPGNSPISFGVLSAATSGYGVVSFQEGTLGGDGWTTLTNVVTQGNGIASAEIFVSLATNNFFRAYTIGVSNPPPSQ